jgi:uncharacterized protein YlxW (UPF0749 family)
LNKPIYVSIVIVSLLLGLMISFQFRTNSSTTAVVPTERYQELTIEKKKVEADITDLEEEVADLTAKIEESRKGRTEAADVFESELNKIKLYAGLTPLVGPGVEVLLENPPESLGGAGFYNIRDEDLLKVINDLLGAGAEAVSINDQRIIATSEVRQAGNHINVNLTKLSPPYRINAIGNPGTLKSSLEIKGGLAEYLAASGTTVNIRQADIIHIPAYGGPLRFDYARQVQRG